MELFNIFGRFDIQGADSAASTISGIGGIVDQVGSKIMGFGGALIDHVTMPIAGMAVEGIKYNSTVQDLSTSFKVMLGSAQDAGVMVEKLKKMGAATPFEFTDLASATKTLLAFGYTGNDVIPIMSKLGDVSLGDNQAFQSMTRVMGQINALGKLQGGDLNQLINWGWNPLNEITKRTGETMEQVRDRMSKGKVTYKEVEQALTDATSKGGRFYNGMTEGSATLSGRISTLKDNFMSFLGDATKPLFDFIANAAVPALIRLVEYFSNMSPAMKQVVAIIMLIVAAIPILITAIGGIIVIIGTVITAIGTFASVGWEVIAISVLVGGAAIALGTAIMGIVTAIGAVLWKTGILQAVFEAVKSTIMALVAIFRGDMKGALSLLENGLGLSHEKAKVFATKIAQLRDAMFRLGGFIKDVSTLLGAIFTADKQKMIDTLVKKFGLSEGEAKKFAKEVLRLKDRVIELGGKIRDYLITILQTYGDKITKVSNYIVDHRAQIAKAIEKIISFGSTVVSIMSKVFGAATKAVQFGSKVADGVGSGITSAISFLNKLKNTAISIFDTVSGAVKTAINFFSALASVIGNVISKIASIVFPSVPSAISSLIGHASGIRNNPIGHWAMVGEQGAELMYVPQGADIYTANETRDILSNSRRHGSPINSSTSNQNIYNIELTADFSKVRNFDGVLDIIDNIVFEGRRR